MQSVWGEASIQCNSIAASVIKWRSCSLLPDDEVDIDGGVNLEVSDVLDSAGWAHDVNDSFVDSHFKSIPGVGSLSTWTFTGGDSQSLSWNSNWSFGFVALSLGVDNNL